MAITHALENGNNVEVYDGNRKLFSKYINKNNGDRLIGYTGNSVTIKIGEFAQTFDENERRICSPQYVGK
ncbi:hypothetical protein O6B42_07715 [Campylobacter ureolyticus]|uniref:hypothetical protein n=1 Tax=Campylobacter ureolyticus TaxID=827 RepID=UPI0022B4B14A|nr:hypothetical protein [Campylobacter ureolyticus]MCZ6133754.1 hypothetical protein [Campylobacter ureolyticus]